VAGAWSGELLVFVSASGVAAAERRSGGKTVQRAKSSRARGCAGGDGPCRDGAGHGGELKAYLVFEVFIRDSGSESRRLVRKIGLSEGCRRSCLCD